MTTGEIIGIVSIVVGIVLGIIGFFLKRTISQVDRLEECKASKEELNDLKCLVEEHGDTLGDIKTNYLTKEDFYREQAKTDRMLTRIYDILLEIKGGGCKHE